MKAQLGKPTGLALALLATLLATFLAMGVFAVAQAQTSHSATRSISETTVVPGGELNVTIAVMNYGNSGLVEETLPAGFSYGNSVPSPLRTQGAVRLWAFEQGVETIKYTVTAPDLPGTYNFNGTFTAGSPAVTVDIGGNSAVTVRATPDPTPDPTMAPTPDPTMAPTPDPTMAPTPDPTMEPAGTGVTLDPQDPGAAVRIEIRANAGEEVTPGEDVSIKLKSFGLPDTISESHVLFSDGGGATDSYIGNPSEARISGSAIILTIPSTLPNGEANSKGVTGRYKVVIKQSAGITNPTAGDDYTVEVDDADADVEKPEATINRVIKLSKTSGTRGTMTTATFKGFANGSATVNLAAGNETASKLAEVTIEDNTGTL